MELKMINKNEDKCIVTNNIKYLEKFVGKIHIWIVQNFNTNVFKPKIMLEKDSLPVLRRKK